MEGHIPHPSSVTSSSPPPLFLLVFPLWKLGLGKLGLRCRSPKFVLVQVLSSVYEVETLASLAREVLNFFSLLFLVFWEHQDLGTGVFWSKGPFLPPSRQNILQVSCTQFRGCQRCCPYRQRDVIASKAKTKQLTARVGPAPPCISFITRNQDNLGVYFWV